MSVPPFDELLDEFQFLGEWEDQCQYLIELGEELPDLKEDEKNKLNLVPGCQSRVWFVPALGESQSAGGPEIEIRAKSDARIVDGLIVVLLSLANHRDAKSVLETDFQDAFAKLGLETHLVPQRRNGLHAMVRRLQAIAATALGVPLDSNDAKPQKKSDTPADFTPLDPNQLKAEFPALNQTREDGGPITYLDSAASAQKPQCVIDKEREVYEQFYANAYRGVYRFGDQVSRELEETREKVRQLIGAEHEDEIAFTAGSTMSLNVIAQGWGRRHLQPGDEIVVSVLEHHASLVPWQEVARATGARLRYLPLTDDGAIDLDRLDEAFSDRTKVLAVAAMSNVFGAIAPLKPLVARAKQTGAVVVVDGAQSVPHFPTDVARDEIDFLVFSGHKLYGPSGVGVLYGRRERLAETDPLLYGGHMIERVERESFTLAPLPAKFEAGTLPIAQAIALGAAVDWTTQVGLEAIHAYEQQLQEAATEKLSAVPGLTLHGPSNDKGAIFSFTLEGASAQDVASLLDLKGVCVRHGHHCAMPLHDWLGVPATVRASFCPANPLEDVDMLVEAIEFAKQKLKVAT